MSKTDIWIIISAPESVMLLSGAIFGSWNLWKILGYRKEAKVREVTRRLKYQKPFYPDRPKAHKPTPASTSGQVLRK